MTIGVLSDGREVRAVDLRAGDLKARVLDHGARLVLYRRGDRANVCVASDSLSDYEGRLRYAGPIVGLVINRIAGARAEIDGQAFEFEANQDGRHSLHSGGTGVHNAIWTVENADDHSVALTADMPDGEGGFPGDRRITAVYALEDDGLMLSLTASTDAPTLMNPGLHGVWNVDGSTDWSDHRLTIPAETYLPTNADKIPTSAVAPVAGTVFDHRTPRTPDTSLDHNYCFESEFGIRARLEGASGQALEIHSDAPGLQVYSGGREGIALEPQLWPDAPHNPDFPSILLRPGDEFTQRSRFLIQR